MKSLTAQLQCEVRGLRAARPQTERVWGGGEPEHGRVVHKFVTLGDCLSLLSLTDCQTASSCVRFNLGYLASTPLPSLLLNAFSGFCGRLRARPVPFWRREAHAEPVCPRRGWHATEAGCVGCASLTGGQRGRAGRRASASHETIKNTHYIQSSLITSSQISSLNMTKLDPGLALHRQHSIHQNPLISKN